MNKVKPGVAGAYILVLAVSLFFYLKYNETIKFFVFTQLEKTIQQNIKINDVLFVNDNFSLKDYAGLIDKIKQSDNSAAILLPQIFHMKTENYMDEVNPEDIKTIKEDYKQVILKLVEAQNVLPVVYLTNDGQNGSAESMESFGYFDAGKINLDLGRYDYNYVMARNGRIFMDMQNVGFYKEDSHYAYKMPLLFKYRGTVLVNPAVEAIRKYYKFPKIQIKLERGELKISNIISLPLMNNGEIMIHRLLTAPKVYNLHDFLALGKEDTADKIIVIDNQGNTADTMLSIGMAAQSILKQEYIRYSANLNYVIAFICLLLFYLAYMNLGFTAGAIVAAVTELIAGVAAAQLLANNFYLDFTLVTAANALAFFTIYFFRISSKAYLLKERKAVFARFMSKDALEHFILKNRDIKIKNTWIKAFAVYLVFDMDFLSDPENIKKVFEKTRKIIYNKYKDALIKVNNSNEISVIFFGENKDLKSFVDLVFEVKNSLAEYNFNILLNDSEIYIFEYNNDIMFIDKNYNLKEEMQIMEKKKYVIAPEKDIQSYINVTKFQKIIDAGGKSGFFNIFGTR